MADTDSRQGLRYSTPEILDWLNRVHAPHDEALERAFTAPQHHGMPAIQLNPSEGRLLELLVLLSGARRVVEVGTLAGYSALHLARALPPGGHLWTLELEERNAAVARANLQAAGLADRVTVVVGPALQSLPGLEPHGPFDLVFVDADKRGYAEYGRWAARHLRPGGLLVGDNVFLFGRLLEDSPEAEAMRRFHQEAASAFHSVCIPTPDGLLVGLKR
jgi:caffeoyl-CoA O-methyltransferase